MARTIFQVLLPPLAALCTLVWGVVPAAALGLVGAVLLHFWLAHQVVAALDPRDEAEQRLAPPASLGSRWHDPLVMVRGAARAWTERADHLRLERRRSDQRILALAELWRSAGEDGPELALFERIRELCRSELGDTEIGLLRLDPRAQELSGHWGSLAAEPLERATTVRWAVANLDGSVARALRSARTVAECDGEGVLLRVNGERPRIAARPGPHVVVPLASPAPRAECLEQGWLHREGCPAFRGHPDALTRATSPAGGRGLDLGPCGGCVHFPVRGVLIALGADPTDPLDIGAVPLLESVALAAASALEHAALYRDLQGAESFRDQVLDAMTNGLVSTDQHGRIVYANQRARELLASEDLLGRRFDECVALPGGSSALTRTILEGQSYLQADGVALVRDADAMLRRVPVRVNLTPFRPEHGGVTGAVCVMEDRSALRAMEKEIRHLDNLAAIGRFASSLAHEVRNPLGGIRAGIDYLGRGLSRADRLDGETKESLGVIQGEIDRIDGILSDLLSVARPREMVLTECDAAELVRRAVRSYAPLAKSLGIELRVGAAARLEPLHVDVEMIHQVLSNLLKNAIEAAHAPGFVELLVQEHPDPTGDESSDGVVIEVLDRGPGIPVGDLSRIFEPFYTQKANGTGLGLYVCHGFVQRHDGRLWAENRQGGGARFVLELPRVPALMGVSR